MDGISTALNFIAGMVCGGCGCAGRWPHGNGPATCSCTVLAMVGFFAGMKRADVFGKIACLSSSFWWANRWAVRWAESHPVPEPRPVLYLDSGAAPSAQEQDAQVKDGFHHTRSMIRAR